MDFTPVNKHAPRQTHHTQSPWDIASNIPSYKVKTVVDNCHGYHSILIHPADCDLTIFITPWGRYRYRTVPQGFLSAGDAYTHRMDLASDFPDSNRCVDDSIIWYDDISTNFSRTCRYLSQCAAGGCVFNPKIFSLMKVRLTFSVSASPTRASNHTLSSLRPSSHSPLLIPSQTFAAGLAL